MDNNTNAAAQAAAEYMRGLAKPVIRQGRTARKVWSIDLEAFWVPLCHAYNVEGLKVVSPEALGAPLRLVKDSDGAVRFSKSGKPIFKVVKEITDVVRDTRDNFTANGLAYIKTVRETNAEAFAKSVNAAADAGQTIIDSQNGAVERAIQKRTEEAAEAAEIAVVKAERRKAKAAQKEKVPAAA